MSEDPRDLGVSRRICEAVFPGASARLTLLVAQSAWHHDAKNTLVQLWLGLHVWGHDLGVFTQVAFEAI